MVFGYQEDDGQGRMSSFGCMVGYDRRQYLLMILKGRFQILKGYENNHVTIGFGSYGQVKLARDLEKDCIVAVKINKIAKNEVLMHYGLSHPKIIKLIDVHIDTEREITYMILQYADGGTLFEKIKMETISKKDLKRYFKDVCEGLAYLHSQNIMHRDIKPQNVLLTKATNEAKLCDFGFAAILGERKTLCGTYQYMSPEMIQNRPYDYKIDIWALGILLFELIAGNAPFKGEKPDDVLEQMKTKIFFCERFELQDINLVKMILRVTPSKRPTIEEILEHPFFKQDSNQKQGTGNSTTNTEDSRAKTSSLQFLSESCNPKKMAELQKVLQKQHQKQTYPPFYAPKIPTKIGTGTTIPIQNQERTFSPMQSKKNVISPALNNTLNGPIYHRPPQQFVPPLSNNKTFGILNNSKSPTVQPENPNAPNQSNLINTSKNNLGYGRYS